MIKVLTINNEFFLGKENGERLTDTYSSIGTVNVRGDLNIAICVGDGIVKYYAYNEINEVIIDIGSPFGYIGYGESLIAFEYDESWHYFDEQLNLVFECKEMARCISSNSWVMCFAVKEDDGEYLYNCKFDKLAGPFNSISYMNDLGQVVVSKKDGENIKYSVLVVLSERMLSYDIPDKYERVEMFEHFRFKTYIGDKCGVFDMDGIEILPCEYDEIFYKGGITNIGVYGYYILKLNAKYGLATQSGKVIANCEYDAIDLDTDLFKPKAEKVEPDGTLTIIDIDY